MVEKIRLGHITGKLNSKSKLACRPCLSFKRKADRLLGDVLILQGKYDMSIYYLSKYIELEKDNTRSDKYLNVISNTIITIKKHNKAELDSIRGDINGNIMTGLCETACN